MGVIRMNERKQKKFKLSMGLAFNEEREMKMLSNMARKGWIFKSFSNLGYHFEKGEPVDLIYSVDNHHLKDEENEQYFQIFKDGGWNHICSEGKYYHFFSAPLNTKPIYTDKETMSEKYTSGGKDVLKASLFLGLIFLILALISMTFNRFLENELFTIKTLEGNIIKEFTII